MMSIVQCPPLVDIQIEVANYKAGYKIKREIIEYVMLNKRMGNMGSFVR